MSANSHWEFGCIALSWDFKALRNVTTSEISQCIKHLDQHLSFDPHDVLVSYAGQEGLLLSRSTGWSPNIEGGLRVWTSLPSLSVLITRTQRSLRMQLWTLRCPVTTPALLSCENKLCWHLTTAHFLTSYTTAYPKTNTFAYCCHYCSHH